MTMRVGVMVGGFQSRIPVEGFVAQARELETAGFDTMWIPHVFEHDAIVLSALVGRDTDRIEIGTAVVPTQPRHPAALAQQALTAAAASDGRFTLGIGLSHPPVIEQMHGLSYARKASHMREVLGVVNPILRGEAVDFQGDEFRVAMHVEVADPQPVPVLLAALGPQMLKLAGSAADGTILWMTGFRGIEEHSVPTIQAAAREAGRPEPRIVAGMHIALTDDVEAGRGQVAQVLERYRLMPSYRAMIEREGRAEPEDFAIVGDEKTLEAGLERLASIGVTDFDANLLEVDAGTKKRTLDFLASWRAR